MQLQKLMTVASCFLLTGFHFFCSLSFFILFSKIYVRKGYCSSEFLHQLVPKCTKDVTILVHFWTINDTSFYQSLANSESIVWFQDFRPILDAFLARLV